MVTWTVCPDAATLESATTDLRRALILQNSRAARRFDPASRVRTHRNEEWLRRFGLVAVALGLALALLLVVGVYATQGVVRPLHALLLVVFVVLLPVFIALPRLRAAAMRRLDAMLARRAAGAIRAWPVSVEREYTIEGSTLRSRTGEASAERPLAGLTYGLRGETVLMLFAKPRSQNPKLIVLVEGDDVEGDAVVEALRAATGAHIERLARELMPATTLERSW